MKAAIVTVSQELLLSALKFPWNTRILRVRLTDRGDLEMVCEHEALPEVEHGKPLPTVKPTIEQVREHFNFYWSLEDFKNGKAVKDA